MLVRMRLLVVTMVRSSSTRALELQNGVAALLAGGMLILPPDSLATAPGYRLFTIWAPEPVWGLSFLGLGVAQVWAALFDLIVLRRIVTAILGVLFTLFTVGIFLSNPVSPVATILAAMSVGQWASFVQARRIM